MTIITIDNLPYYLDSLSTEVRPQIMSMQFVDQKLARFKHSQPPSSRPVSFMRTPWVKHQTKAEKVVHHKQNSYTDF